MSDLYEKAFMHNHNGILITNHQSKILQVNEAFANITGYSIEELTGQTTSLLNSGRHNREFYEQMWLTLTNKESWQGEIWNRRKDGTIFPVYLTIVPIVSETGEITHYLGSYTNLTRIKLVENQLKYLETFDSVTGLINHQTFKNNLYNFLKSNDNVAVFCVRLRRFKAVNENFSSLEADKLLHLVGRRLQKIQADPDWVARNPGHEFLIAKPNFDSVGDCVQFADKIISSFKEAFYLQNRPLFLGVSIGISLLPDDAAEMDDLLKHSAQAVTRAKQTGNNNFEFYQEEMNAYGTNQMQMESDLRRGLQQNEFVLYYQPKWYIQNHTLAGFEALIRWNHPEMGIIPPGAFIPLAEMTGLMAELGAWVLNEATRALARWSKAGYFVPVAVNVSTQQFNDRNLLPVIQQALEETAIHPSLLELEITESIAMHDSDATSAQLKELKKMGLTLAIDDFGTGYSSLAYLRRFPLDCLKIDRSFIKDIDKTEKDLALAKSMIVLGHSLGMKVVAEGVERSNQNQSLIELGCDIAQGYLHGRPEDEKTANAIMHGSH